MSNSTVVGAKGKRKAYSSAFKLEAKMRVFKSLNCIVCKEPFSRIANQPRSPRHLNCGLAMCNECFVKEEEMDREERNHQCGNSDCFNSENFAYFLIDVLSQENALMFTPIGYVLVKSFKIPKCPICHVKYSNKIAVKKSFALKCGHIICMKCSLKTRKQIHSFLNDYHRIKCPVCKRTHKYASCIAGERPKNRFRVFLSELPGMTRQMKKMHNSKIKASMNAVMNTLTSSEDDRSCDECHEKNIVDKMFYCDKCSFELCGACAYKKHHPHKAIPLLEKKASQMSMELQQESRNVIKTYKNLVPELHKGLLESISLFETELLSKEETLKDTLTMADLQEKHESFTKIRSKFKSSAEDYLPRLRKFDIEVKELIQTLNDIPVFKKPKMEIDT